MTHTNAIPSFRAKRGIPLSFFLALSLVGALPTFSQVQTGTPPFGSFTGGPDIINLGNLNSHITVPILHRSGRGTDFSYNLGYDSAVWQPVTSGSSQSWQPVYNWGWLAETQVATGYLSYAESIVSARCTNSNGQVIIGQRGAVGNLIYYDAYGSPHRFPGEIRIVLPPCYPPSGGSLSNVLSTDGSGYSLSMTVDDEGNITSYQVVSKIGAQLFPPLQQGTGSGNFTDRNGNEITVSSAGVFTDTLGSTALTFAGSGTPSSPITFTYTAPSGGSPEYKMIYTAYTVKTNFGCSNITEYGPTSNNLVSEIDLPDGSKYTFAYEPTPSFSGDVTGRLKSVTLPTGGTITYSYTGGNNGINCSDGSTATLTRATPDGTWTYARGQVSGAEWKTLITDPTSAANQTLIYFQKDSAGTSTNNFYETQRQVYQGSTSGTLLRQWFTCYNSNGTPSTCATTAVSSPITQQTVTDQYGSGGLQCQHIYKYNSVGGLSEQDDYDYGSGGAGGLLRQTLVTYASLPPNITAFRQQVTVKNGSGTTLAQTNYNYDQGTLQSTSGLGIPQHTSVSGSRGNLTSINYPVSGLTASFTYYDTGSPYTSQDVNAATTTYNYSGNAADCQMAFPTSVSEPLSMSQSFAWNCTGGVMTQLTDENGNNSSVSFTDPYYWRPASTTDQTNVTTNICYAALTSSGCPSTTSATQVETYLNFNSNNSTVDALTTVDGLGRVMLQQKRQGPGSASFDTVETAYNAVGGLYWTSLPYAGTAGQTNPSAPSLNNQYDALGRRTWTGFAPGGGLVNFSYTNNDVLVAIGPAPSGENTKQRQLEYDALGRLTSVCEITAGTTAWPGASCGQNTAATGYLTKYTYDALGDLLTVTQNAQSGGNQQARSYSFDAMSRLISETNAESGTTTYTYDTDSTCGTSKGDLVKKVDAAGNTTCSNYDVLHRVTSISYPSGPNSSSTAMKVFYYDTSHFNATYNTKGRLASAGTCQNPTCAGPWITAEDFSYSVRGELTDLYEWTTNSGGWYHTTQTYWPHGAPSQLSNLTGLPTISYGGTIGSTVGLDGEGRITQVTAASGQNPVTGVAYNNGSMPTQVSFGSGDNDIFAYDPNTLRMTQFKFNVGTQSQYLNGALTWNANSSLSQLAITDQYNSSDTQTCNYTHDDLARIATANCGSAANQTFGYDPFGNISKSGSPNSFQPTYSAATNRFSSIPGCSSLSYDSDGNVLNDCNHAYSWNADGRPTAIDAVSVTYDAFGRIAEENKSGTYYQFIYSPSGPNLAITSGGGLILARVPLPGGGIAEYDGSGALRYRHPDWLGNVRLISTQNRAVYSDTAYAPFGETYASSGASDISFTGVNADTTGGSLYDFLFREYSNEGRWVSPDPAGLAAVDPSNPQSWNRYSYVLNNPLRAIDPLGLSCLVLDDGTYADDGDGLGCADAGVAAGGGGDSGYDDITPDQVNVDDSVPSDISDFGGFDSTMSDPGNVLIGPSGAADSTACVVPTGFQKAGIAVQRWVANLTNKTIGVGAGISASGGPFLGVNFTASRQLVVSPNGQAAYVSTFNNMMQLPFNAIVLPAGAGGYGGLQISVSNAQTPQDLSGNSFNYGFGGGRGWGGGGDLTIGKGSQGQPVWSLTGTAGAGAGGQGHGATITASTVTPICN